MEEADVGPSGRGGAFGGPLPRRITRLQSPPCYRNVFLESDSEEAFAPWKAPRPAAQHLTRYRCGSWVGRCRLGGRAWLAPDECMLNVAVLVRC